MISEKNVLGFVHPGRESRRPPLVGMDFLHERLVRSADLVSTRSRLHPKDLVSFLLGHRVTAPPSPPRCRVLLEVFTPSGRSAVQIGFQD